MIYHLPSADSPIAQGDLIRDYPVATIPVDLASHDSTTPVDVITTTVVILTQSCDLIQNKADRVVVAPVHTAQSLVAKGVVKSQTVRDQIRLGKVYGWYFLPEGPPTHPFAESVVDLRDLATVPRKIIDQLVASGQRVGRLVTPYREHLAQHFAVTYMRIALPEPYATAPG